MLFNHAESIYSYYNKLFCIILVRCTPQTFYASLYHLVALHIICRCCRVLYTISPIFRLNAIGYSYNNRLLFDTIG